MGTVSRALVVAFFVVIVPAWSTPVALAQDAAARACDPGGEVSDPARLEVLRSCTAGGKPYFTTKVTGATGRITVIVSGLARYQRGYEARAKKDPKSVDPKLDPSQLILYVDGLPLHRFFGRLPDRDHSDLTFDLRTLAHDTAGVKESRDAWKLLLSDGIRDRKMRLSVGFAGRGPLASDIDDFELQAISWQWLGVWWGLSLVLLGLLYWGRDMLRVPAAAPAEAGAAPAPKTAFSLARTQMAAWFFAILVGYVFIYLVTGGLDTISVTVLGLMGISAATGFAATVVDNSLPPDPAAAQSQGLLRDLAMDKGTLSLPRTQILVWTVVLIWIFARAIYDTLAMPDFDATLLGLMGISGGTYVGFKKPDNKP